MVGGDYVIGMSDLDVNQWLQVSLKDDEGSG